MPYFIKSGDKFKVTSSAALDLHDKLPTGTYSVDVDACTGELFLQIIEPFQLTGKLYGETTRHSNRILSTFLNRESSTGVLLAGEKGSGKTLLSKHLSIQAAEEHGIPTLVVNKALSGEKFNTFLQTIEQPTVIIFDEFEKVYQRPDLQEAMLTLLDGVYPSKKLFLLTCNEKNRININMKNRPGRIYYLIDFHGLSQKFIREYCEDNLKDKSYIDTVCNTALLFDAFNFDMMKAMVEEMNRYGESPSEVLKFLNVRPAFDTRKRYTAVLQLEGGVKEEKEWSGQPLLQEIPMSHLCKKSNETQYFKFTAKDLTSMDGGRGKFTFINQEKKAQLDLTEKVKSFAINYDNLVPGSLNQSIVQMDQKQVDGTGTEPTSIDSEVLLDDLCGCGDY